MTAVTVTHRARMSQTIVYIAFGGNIGDSRWIFREAKLALKSEIGPVVGSSRLYSARPMVDPHERIKSEQSIYLNAAASFETGLSPEEVLQVCIAVEKEHGRDRSSGIRWGARTLDLDIIAYGDSVVDLPTLTIPHPEMHLRDFVLYPLADINPYYMHPLRNRTVLNLIESLPDSNDTYVTEVDSSPW